MTKISHLVVGASLAIASVGVQASPMVFSFDMPQFVNIGPFPLMTSTLQVTVDNGSSATTNQTYLNTDITNLLATIGSVSVGGPANNFLPAFATQPVQLAYITTDAFGIPTLDLNSNVSSRAAWFGGATAAQPHLIIGTGNSVPYSVRTMAGQRSSKIGSAGNIMFVGTVASVPAPAGLALFGIGFAALGLWGRRCAQRRA